MTDVAIRFPTDAYLHVGAPREWWWHIGTLQAGARRFGFEINAAGFSAAEPHLKPSCFSQVMLSDPANQKHYKKTDAHAYDPTWAEPDTSRPWYARIGDLGSNDWVFMQSVAGIDSLTVQASFTDDPSGEIVKFDLRMTQRGPPLYVWGTGVAANIVPTGKTPLERNNYYYSYTNLRVDGTVKIGKEAIAVAGVTWMDHEYGAFGAGTRWALQDAQLSNGVSITNSAVGDFVLEAGKPIATLATILENGISKLALLALTTPSKPWSYQGTTYFLHWKLEIPGHGAVLEFEALMKDQMFPADQRPIYEGAATVAGLFDGLGVVGTGWIEQAIAPLQKPAAGPAPGRGMARLQSPA